MNRNDERIGKAFHQLNGRRAKSEEIIKGGIL
jgi:hypothetical protein